MAAGDSGEGAARTLAALLGWARIGVGASVWTAPRGSMLVLGFDPGNPQVMALARLAGTRDIALGAAAAASAGDPLAATTITRVNAIVDGFDALAFGIALLRRDQIQRAAVMGTLSAAAGAVVGVALASRLEALPKSG
jgi:hypothetical protein